MNNTFLICEAYESGFGHGIKNDGHSVSPYKEADQSEAYEHGYKSGLEKYNSNKPITVDMNLLLRLANKAFGSTVDHDFVGNPITNYDVLLHGAYGPAISRLCNLVLAEYGSTNMVFPILKDKSPGANLELASKMVNSSKFLEDLEKDLFKLRLEIEFFSKSDNDKEHNLKTLSAQSSLIRDACYDVVNTTIEYFQNNENL